MHASTSIREYARMRVREYAPYRTTGSYLNSKAQASICLVLKVVKYEFTSTQSFRFTNIGADVILEPILSSSVTRLCFD